MSNVDFLVRGDQFATTGLRIRDATSLQYARQHQKVTSEANASVVGQHGALFGEGDEQVLIGHDIF